VPAEIIEPLHRILAGWSEIEGFPLRYELIASEPGCAVNLGRGLSAIPLRTHHRVPSLAWVVRRHTQRLDAEYEGRAPEELQRLRESGAKITHEVITPLLCVTGDTKFSFFLEHELVRQCKVLVHECTAWDERRGVESTREWGHTHVDEWVEHVEAFEGEALVLVHRSLRHSRRFAEKVVRERFPAHVQDKIHVFGH
jgi:ribonuclease Z